MFITYSSEIGSYTMPQGLISCPQEHWPSSQAPTRLTFEKTFCLLVIFIARHFRKWRRHKKWLTRNAATCWPSDFSRCAVGHFDLRLNLLKPEWQLGCLLLGLTNLFSVVFEFLFLCLRKFLSPDMSPRSICMQAHEVANPEKLLRQASFRNFSLIVVRTSFPFPCLWP